MFSTNDNRYQRPRYAIYLGDTCHICGLSKCSNLLQLLVAEFAAWIVFSIREPLSTALGNHVSSVVLRGAEKKMRRIDANRVVAGVAYKEIIGDISFMQKVGMAMSSNIFPSQPENAIAVLTYCAFPWPAFISVCRLFNVEVKPLIVREITRCSGRARASDAAIMLFAQTLASSRRSANCTKHGCIPSSSLSAF